MLCWEVRGHCSGAYIDAVTFVGRRVGLKPLPPTPSLITQIPKLHGGEKQLLKTPENQLSSLLTILKIIFSCIKT